MAPCRKILLHRVAARPQSRSLGSNPRWRDFISAATFSVSAQILERRRRCGRKLIASFELVPWQYRGFDLDHRENVLYERNEKG